MGKADWASLKGWWLCLPLFLPHSLISKETVKETWHRNGFAHIITSAFALSWLSIDRGKHSAELFQRSFWEDSITMEFFSKV